MRRHCEYFLSLGIFGVAQIAVVCYKNLLLALVYNGSLNISQNLCISSIFQIQIYQCFHHYKDVYFLVVQNIYDHNWRDAKNLNITSFQLTAITMLSTQTYSKNKSHGTTEEIWPQRRGSLTCLTALWIGLTRKKTHGSCGHGLAICNFGLFLGSRYIPPQKIPPHPPRFSVATLFRSVARFARGRIEDSSFNRFALNGVQEIACFIVFSS